MARPCFNGLHDSDCHGDAVDCGRGFDPRRFVPGTVDPEPNLPEWEEGGEA